MRFYLKHINIFEYVFLFIINANTDRKLTLLG